MELAPGVMSENDRDAAEKGREEGCGACRANIAKIVFEPN